MHCLLECKMMYPCKKQFGSFSISSTELPYDQEISLLGVYLNELITVFKQNLYRHTSEILQVWLQNTTISKYTNKACHIH